MGKNNRNKDKIEFIDIDDTGVLESMVSDELYDRETEPLNDEDFLDEDYAENGDDSSCDYDDAEEEPEYDSHVEAFENGGTDEEHAGSEVFQGEILEDVFVDDIVTEDVQDGASSVKRESSKKSRKARRVRRNEQDIDEFADLDKYDEPEVFDDEDDPEDDPEIDELPEIDDEFGNDGYDDNDGSEDREDEADASDYEERDRRGD